MLKDHGYIITTVDVILCSNQKELNAMRRFLLIWAGLCCMTQADAFPCYITLIKDSCWAPYDVSMDVIDVSTEKVVATMSMPKGTSWDRKEMVCQPKQTVKLQATFNPAFWAQDQGKNYYGKRFWSFPEEIKKGDAAWNMELCFAQDFDSVPLPPGASGQCVCEKTGIPVIPKR